MSWPNYNGLNLTCIILFLFLSYAPICHQYFIESLNQGGNNYSRERLEPAYSFNRHHVTIALRKCTLNSKSQRMLIYWTENHFDGSDSVKRKYF